MWPTPTPIPTSLPPEMPIDPAAITQTFADGIVQGFNWFDTQPIATAFFFIALISLIYLGIMSIRRHLEKL